MTLGRQNLGCCKERNSTLELAIDTCPLFLKLNNTASQFLSLCRTLLIVIRAFDLYGT